MSDYVVESTSRRRGAGLWARNRRTTLLTITSALVAVAPKCPICFLAYFGIFGVATASASAYRVWLPPITGIWLALTVTLLAFRRRGTRRCGPAALGFVAGLMLMTGKFVIDNRALIYAGIVALLGAAVWRSLIQESISAENCSGCEELPLVHDE